MKVMRARDFVTRANLRVSVTPRGVIEAFLCCIPTCCVHYRPRRFFVVLATVPRPIQAEHFPDQGGSKTSEMVML